MIYESAYSIHVISVAAFLDAEKWICFSGVLKVLT